MTQMAPPQALSLFDLIGRTWELGDGVKKLLFNKNEATLLALHDSGQLSFVAVADAEAPEKRMRMELETGRMTIRPREAAVPPPKRSEAGIANGSICAVGDKGFVFVHKSGNEIWQATAGGQVLRLSAQDGPEVTGLAYLETRDLLVVASGTEVSLASLDGGKTLASRSVGHDVLALSVAPDGSKIACAGGGKISILSSEALVVETCMDCEGQLLDFAWSPDGRWLVAGSAAQSIHLIDLQGSCADRIIDFPAAVRNVEFNAMAKTLIASGAFRVVGWQLPDLPFGDHEGAAIETGKAGLTIVDSVAAHPTKDLCAVGYANGLVTVCQIGRKDEMMLREGTGPVTSLVWSSDGAHLGIGTEDGVVALATIPKSMLK